MNYRLYLMPFTKCTVQRRPFNFPDKKCDLQRILRKSSLPFGRAKRDARERASESGWGEEPFVVNTISCGTFAVTVFTLCGIPRFPGGIENLWVIVASSPFSPRPPAFASALARLFFTISRNGELAYRLSATCRHMQYSDALHTTKVTKDFLYLFICYGYVRLNPFPCINSLFWFQSVTVRDVNSLPFSLLIASPGNVVWKE